MKMKWVGLVLLITVLPLPCRSQFVPEQTPGDAVSQEVVSRENVGNLARKQGIQEIVLHKKDSIFSNGQISCESGLACRHLPAEENQLR